MKESRLQKLILDYCKAQKIYTINIYGGGRCGKGTPDIILCLDGLFVAMECKVGNNSLQDDQVIHSVRIKASGGKWYCIRSLEEAIDTIEKLRKENESRLYHPQQ